MAETDQVSAAEPGADEPEPPSKTPLVIAAVLAAIGLGAIGVYLLDPFAGGDEPGADAVAHAAVAADVEVDGEPLPAFEDPDADEAIGMPAPALRGTGLDDRPLTIDPADGTPRVILFVAHWCPVCQDEIASLQQARDDGALHDDVELVAVSTGVRKDAENFPPGEWFAAEGWDVPTLIDNEQGHAAGAYGLQAYPYWVFTRPDGDVVGRLAGALALEDLQQLMEELAVSQ